VDGEGAWENIKSKRVEYDDILNYFSFCLQSLPEFFCSIVSTKSRASRTRASASDEIWQKKNVSQTHESAGFDGQIL
jgi:hypothetical protein